jgi:phosphoglycerol transferase MdoB-like AlkP superfamily enzyme
MFRRSLRISDDFFFIALCALAVLKMVLVRFFLFGEANPLPALLLESALVIVVLGLVDLSTSRRRYLLTLSAYGILSVLLLTITVYVAFYAQLFDPRMLSVAGQLTTVGPAIGSLFKPIYLLFVVDLPFLAWWAVKLGRADNERLASDAASAAVPATSMPKRADIHTRPGGRSPWVAGALSIALVVFGAQLAFALQIPIDVDPVAVATLRGLGVAQISVFVPRGSEDAAQADVVDDQLAPASSVTASAAAAATLTPVSAPPPLPVTAGSKLQDRIETIRGSENGSRIATFSVGAFAGKNVITIQVEALNTMVVQERLGGVEITPNLNALINESWYFPNTYSETGLGNTADAEFVVNSSLYTPKGQAAPVAYVDRKIPGLPRLLGQQGYDTFTLHANKVGYWNRKELYAALGFSRYYDRNFLRSEDMFNEMGSSDEVLFRKGSELLRQSESTTTPYYAQFITLSAHTPFVMIPQARRPIKTPADLKGSLMGDYISAESYSDFAIGQFISQLKADGIWDDSIVIIYGDHTAMNENSLSGKDGRAAEKLLGRPYSAVDRQRVPMIIHLPGQTKPELVTATAGHVDIMPTIADLVGLDLRGTPHMGRSVFVSSNSLVPMRSYLPGGTFANDSVVYLPGVSAKDGKALTIESGKRVAGTERERTDSSRVSQLTKLSDKWVLSLPKRKNAGKLADSWIPNREARQAAEPLGARQGGNN